MTNETRNTEETPKKRTLSRRTMKLLVVAAVAIPTIVVGLMTGACVSAY